MKDEHIKYYIVKYRSFFNRIFAKGVSEPVYFYVVECSNNGNIQHFGTEIDRIEISQKEFHCYAEMDGSPDRAQRKMAKVLMAKVYNDSIKTQKS